MAKRIVTVVVDDLTGEPLGDDAVTVRFALSGRFYEIDLSRSAAADFRAALAPYTAAARKVGRDGGRSTSTSAAIGEHAAARAWLLGQGVDAPSRGRISADLLGRYRNR